MNYFTLIRIALGSYLAVHFAQLFPYAEELFGAGAPSLAIAATALSVLLTLDIGRRTCSLLLWMAWAAFFNLNYLISNPGLPYVGLLLLLSAATPGKGRRCEVITRRFLGSHPSTRRRLHVFRNPEARKPLLDRWHRPPPRRGKPARQTGGVPRVLREFTPAATQAHDVGLARTRDRSTPDAPPSAHACDQLDLPRRHAPGHHLPHGFRGSHARDAADPPVRF